MIVLSFSIKVFAFVGLSLDIFGVYKLFSLEPRPLKEANLDDYKYSLGSELTKEEENSITISRLNDSVEALRNETIGLKEKSNKYFKFILIGFLFQLLSIILSLFN